MCGRIAYSLHAISAAAALLENGEGGKSVADGKSTGLMQHIPNEVKNQPNTGPGNKFVIFRSSRRKSGKDDLDLCTAIWGLIPNNGTQHSPHLLPTDPKFSVSPHYAMFNARSETIYEKRSFNGLIRHGQTCVFAVEGYYEWTTSQSPEAKKQPYFVCYKDKRPLLLAGLWSCVKTGRQTNSRIGENDSDGDTMTTFTILTTDAHPDYVWLHPRQPVMLWDNSIALEWLRTPNSSIIDMLRSVPISGIATEGGKQQSIWEAELSVYPVSNKINHLTYQGDDCMVEVKLEKAPSIKSFFSPGAIKKAKIEKVVKGISSQPHPATPLGYSLPEPKESSTMNQVSHSLSKCLSHSAEFKASKDVPPKTEKTWACWKCTYLHSDPTNINYLTCEMCGSQRSSPETSDNTDRDRKRKAAT
jgi:putative SOS response-associated peptidase YedK